MDQHKLPRAEADQVLIDGITGHLEPLFGLVKSVYNESQPSPVHVDIHQFEGVEAGFRTFVTTGMASRPMNVPSQVINPECYRYAEILLHLPVSWPVMNFKKLQLPENFWPIGALNNAAYLPHEKETWLWSGHTIATGEESYAEDTRLCAELICPSYLLLDGFETVTLEDGRQVILLTLAFIYQEELAFCEANGSAKFFDRLRLSGFSPKEFFVLDKNRRNVCL